MSTAATGDLVAAAARENRAVAAVNVITLEHAEAICAAAAECGVPVILQISENAVRFHGGRVRPITAAAAEVARAAAVPVALHLDHVTDEALVAQAADAGFSSVMFDAAALPYEENVARTARAARLAHDGGLWVEAELGYVGGKPEAPQSAHAAGVRTDPTEAADYVARTGVDALAVAVGSRHAMTARTAVLDLELVERLHARLAVPLVLHGSSGVPDEQLRAAAAAGVRKINVGTALNVAMTRAIRASLAEDDRLVDPRAYLAPAREAMAGTVGHLLGVLR
jgi:fructose-bisphosphate aldolase, class II